MNLLPTDCTVMCNNSTSVVWGFFKLYLVIDQSDLCRNLLKHECLFLIVFREKRRKRSRDRDNKKDRPQDVSNSLSGDTFCVIVDEVSY